MKKIIFFILLTILFSCEKVEDYCWDCLQIEVNLDNMTLHYNPFEMCNKTEEEIRIIEDTYTYIICNKSSVTKCTKNDDEWE